MGTICLVCIAFLLGSFPSGLVLSNRFLDRDIRNHGSGNFGASNVADAAGLKIGVAVGAMDILKGLIPVVTARMLGMDHVALATVALAAVLGHDFSLYLRFKGGKGVATTFGVALALSPLAGIGVMVLWYFVHRFTRYASVASLAALAVLPIIMWALVQPRSYVLLGIFLFVLGAAKHWENIIRLSRGEERRMERSLPRRPFPGKR